MRLFVRPCSAALLLVILASCNTTETLTPQADVGRGGNRGSTPVTQAETDRMAQSPRPETYNSRNDGYRSGPQSTLEAQARALESGGTSPSSSGPPPQWEGQQQVQDRGRIRGEPARDLQPPSSASAAPPPSQPQQSASLPPATSASTVSFLPIIGAPVQAVTPLSRQLGAQARANGLTIRPSSDTTTEQILKGYFSAFADGGKVTIVYVWDVLDNSGARLHRMQGQETVRGSGADPWTSVPASTMETIGTKTIKDYISWRQSRG